MARLQVIEDDQFALSANPWEEELRRRDDKNDDEEEEQIQASQQILLPNRSIPMPETRTQKELALIFGKVDRQIELLDKQVNTIQAELLQARKLVTAVRNSVANFNKPEASELLERDAFTNYLRITDRLRAIANNMCMIAPDHGRQVVRAYKNYTYNQGFVYSDSDLGEPDPEPIIDEWTASESDRLSFDEQYRFSESAFDDSRSYEASIRPYGAYPLDVVFPPPSPPQQPTRKWPSSNRTRYARPLSPPPRVIYDRGREPILRDRRAVYFTPTFRSRSSSAVTNMLAYDGLSDSSSMEYWPRQRNLRPWSPYSYHSPTRRAKAAARRSRRLSLSHPEGNETEPRGRQVAEKTRILSEEPRLVFVEPKGTQQALSLEAILHEERTFLLEKLYKVQEQLEAAQGRLVVRSSVRDGDEVKGSVLKEKFWTRLKSKFVDHGKKQDGYEKAK